VRLAGAWVFDRVMAGWDVTVLTASQADSRPLRILGADTADIGVSPALGRAPQLLAVCTELPGYAERVRHLVRSVEGVCDVWLWGERQELPEAADEIRHRPSVAARAFKAHALAAVGVPAQSCGEDEVFYRYCGQL
jgi:hypothetical protein